MSSNWRKQKYQRANQDNQFEVTDAHIVKIVSVHNPVLRALVANAHQGYFDVAGGHGRMMTLDEAQKIWRQDPRFIDRSEEKEGEANSAGDLGGGAFEKDATDVDAYISEVMLQESHSFNADQHDWYQRHKRALHLRATCIVTYDNNQQYARVVGEWPTLSRAVKLCIKGQIDDHDQHAGGARMAIVDTSRKAAEHGIDLARIETVKGNDFLEMLTEKGMHVREATMHLLNYFAKPSETLEQPEPEAAAASNGQVNLAPVVYKNRFAYQNAVVAHQSGTPARSSVLVDDDEPNSAATAFDRVKAERDRLFEVARNIVLPVKELWQRIVDSKIDQKKFLETEFVSLSLRMVLLSPELGEIREAFESRDVQIDAVARGVDYIRTVVRLMHEQPHILCFQRMRKLYGEEANIRILQLLPDLSLDSYSRLMRKYNMPRDIIREVAVDIYSSILRYDVYGDGKPPTERSFSTSNMYSVFGAPESERNAEYYHGTADYKRERPDPVAALRQYNTMAHTGRFAFPDDPDASLDTATRLLLLPDVSRLRQPCTSEEFIAALRWMISTKIAVRERFTGVGPSNKGMPVDAVFIAEVHDVQQRIVAILTDIYKRGVKQSMHHSTTELTDARLVALYQSIQTAREGWRDDYMQAVMAGSQDQRTLITVPHNDELSAATHAVAANAAEPQDTGAGRTLISQLARRIAREEAVLQARYDSIMADMPYDDSKDAYSDARRSHLMRRMPLLRVRKPPMMLANGEKFADEQIDAIERINCMPVTFVTGRGGVGKSELLAYIAQQYLPHQIAYVAFTGQVASELARRTGVKAKTVHSMLFRHTKYLEAKYRASAYRKHALARGNKPPEQCAEAFNQAGVERCRDDRELRAYVEHVLDSHPPMVTPFETTRFLAVDELTLLAAPLFLRLLEAAHCPAQGRFLERVAYFGDLDQLAAIGWGNVPSDFAHGVPWSTAQLRINHRSFGHELFGLAEAIATHQHKLPMPPFEQNIRKALRDIQNPDSPPIIALHTMTHDMADKLKCVITELGAIDDEAKRAKIQCIATTNDEVAAANGEIRWHYFGKPRTAAAVAAAANNGAVQLIRAQQPVSADKLAEERERLAAQINMRVYIGDRIYLKENSKIIYKGRHPGEPDREKNFYNSRLLEAMQFYNGPKKLIAGIKCRCGICPPPDPNHVSEVPLPCMERLDLVPPGRQRRADASDARGSNYYEYHDSYMPGRGDQARRIAVFRDESGNYIELDVERMMRPRSRFDFGFALTTHKMQGSQQSIIIYICTRSPAYVTWKPVYTAATRAQHKLIIMSSEDVFDQSVRRKDPLRRSMVWSKLFESILEVLLEYPDSDCARMARASCPQVFGAAPLNDEDRWNVFEKLRYEPAPPARLSLPPAATPPLLLPAAQPPPIMVPAVTIPPPLHIQWRQRVKQLAMSQPAVDKDDDRLVKRRKTNE